MKFSKKLIKIMAILAMSAMLLVTTASASDIRVPNMGTVTVQYSSMVSAANDFDSNLGSLIVDALTKNCYSVDAINAMIAATNNAITALNNVRFIDAGNTELPSNNGQTTTLVRENGFVGQARTYLSAAQLPNAVSFGFSSEKTADMMAVDTATGSKNPTSEYFDKLDFKTSTPLYSTGTVINVVVPGAKNTNNNNKIDTVDIKGVSDVVTKLNKYVTLLNRVKDFDTSAGCYDGTGTVVTTPPTTTTPPAAIVPVATCGYIYADEIVELYVGEEFDIMASPNVYAEDDLGNDISDLITTEGEVNTAVAGEYEVIYSLPDCDEQVSVIVIVCEAVPAVADAVIYANDVNLGCDAGAFIPEDYAYALDDAGNGADVVVTATGNVNTAVAGTYNVLYSATGENGNTVTKQIAVTVEAETLNAVLEGVQDRTIFLGDPFDAKEGVTAYDVDGRDSDITDKIQVEGYVDTAIAGEYYLTYTVIGSCGVAVSDDAVITVKQDIKNAIIAAYDRTIACNADFDKMKDVRAYDNNGAGKDITGDVWVDGFVDTKIEGDYVLVYSVIGSNGLRVDKEVVITVSCAVCPEVCVPQTINCAVPVICEATPPPIAVEPTVCVVPVEPTVCVPAPVVVDPIVCVVPPVVEPTVCVPVVDPVEPTVCLPVVVEPIVCVVPPVVEPTVCVPVVDPVEPTVCLPVVVEPTVCLPVVVEPTVCVPVVVEPTVCVPVVATEPPVVVEPTICVPVVATEPPVVVEPTICVPVVATEPPVVVEPTVCVPVVEKPIEIVLDPCRIEIIIDCEPVPTVCVPVETVPTEPIPVEPIPTEPVPVETIPTEPIPVQPISTEPATTPPENIMQSTGSNIAELALTCLSLLGTAVFIKKRR